MNKDVLKSFIKHYGMIKQMEVAVEECSELIKAIMKFIRNDAHISTKEDYMAYSEAIIEEIADVEIMLEQLKIMFNCEEAVKEQITYKTTRQLERMINNR